MRIHWKFLLFVSLIGYGAYQHFLNSPVARGNGVIAEISPIQQPTIQANFSLNGYNIIPLQAFAIKARVLSTSHYSFDREAQLAPVDLALGWGPMSDEAVIKDIKISQTNRFYYWHVDDFKTPRAQIETNSANMHMIPANKQIEKTLNSIKQGQVIDITGFLVEAVGPDGWRWKSSLSRDDTGMGACELVYISAISVH